MFKMLLNNFRSFRFQTAQKNVTKYSQQKILNDNIYFYHYFFLQNIAPKTVPPFANYYFKNYFSSCSLQAKKISILAVA